MAFWDLFRRKNKEEDETTAENETLDQAQEGADEPAESQGNTEEQVGEAVKESAEEQASEAVQENAEEQASEAVQESAEEQATVVAQVSVEEQNREEAQRNVEAQGDEAAAVLNDAQVQSDLQTQSAAEAETGAQESASEQSVVGSQAQESASEQSVVGSQTQASASEQSVEDSQTQESTSELGTADLQEESVSDRSEAEPQEAEEAPKAKGWFASLFGQSDKKDAASESDGKNETEEEQEDDSQINAETQSSAQTEESETAEYMEASSETSPETSEEESESTDGEQAAEEQVAKKGFFARLKEGLSKTRANIVRGIDNLFSGFTSIDDDFYEELEEILIMGDIGVNATAAIIEKLKQQVKEKHIKEPAECKSLLIEGIKEQMQVGETAYEFEKQQSIVMVIGVNGVGKTTTVGKLAWKLKDEGRKVLIAAADTFRAAAGDQLAEWASRAGVPMIGGREGADPASVVFDAVSAAKARGVDVLLIDTAGRLHNKKNLMEELRKMNRIIDKEFPNCHRENLIVLDGTTGQNALAQAREFGDVAQLTGIVLTKMDGTAKGGIAVAIQSELKIPVKYIGVGETTQDLQKFDPEDFVNALFEVEGDKENEQEE